MIGKIILKNDWTAPFFKYFFPIDSYGFRDGVAENDSHLGGNVCHKFSHCVLAANLYD